MNRQFRFDRILGMPFLLVFGGLGYLILLFDRYGYGMFFWLFTYLPVMLYVVIFIAVRDAIRVCRDDDKKRD